MGRETKRVREREFMGRGQIGLLVLDTKPETG